VLRLPIYPCPGADTYLPLKAPTAYVDSLFVELPPRAGKFQHPPGHLGGTPWDIFTTPRDIQPECIVPSGFETPDLGGALGHGSILVVGRDILAI